MPGCVPKAPSWSGYPRHAPCAAVGHGLPGPLLRQRAPLGPTASHAGGQQTVMEGLQQLAELVAQGGKRISVMPGGGVDADNVATVARVTGE